MFQVTYAVFVLAFLILAILIQYKILRRRVFLNLKYICQFNCSEATEGDVIELVETVENRKRLSIPWLCVRIHTSKWLDYAQSVSSVVENNRIVDSSFFLKGFQKKKKLWKLKCLKRGLFTIENATLISGDLLSLKRISKSVSINEKLLVYPGILPLEALFVPVNSLPGDHLVRRWIIDDPFIINGVREYSPTDPMNKIHWGATAREGRLMIKKSDFTSCQNLTVILNVQSFEDEFYKVSNKDDIELGVKVAATLLIRAQNSGIPSRLLVNCKIPGTDNVLISDNGTGAVHTRKLLEQLALIELNPQVDFGDFLKTLSLEINNSEVIIISAYSNKGILNFSRSLKYGTNHVSVIILDDKVVKEYINDIDIYYLSGAVAS